MNEKKQRGLAVPNPERRQCSAHSSRTGERCKKPPIKGGTVCGSHGGRAPAVRRKAQERILAAADMAAGRLIEFMNDKRVPYPVRLQATRDLLDRAGLGAAQMVKLGIGNDDPWSSLLDEIMNDDVLERVDPKALPARRGGLIERDWAAEDAEDRPAVRRVIEVDPDDDLTADDLSLDIPGTIRGEVVRSSRTAEPRVPARIREGLGLPAASGPSWSR